MQWSVDGLGNNDAEVLLGGAERTDTSIPARQARRSQPHLTQGLLTLTRIRAATMLNGTA